MKAAEWKKFILDWSKSVDSQNFDKYGGDKRVFDTAHGFGTIGASEEMIKATEARLDIVLPPSYREFLKATNGLHQPLEQLATSGGDFWSVEEINWFRVRDSDWIEAWCEVDPVEVPDAQYFIYGEEQDCCNLRSQYLKTALAISHDGDAGIYLLIPEVKNREGEWEAWHFASWKPGADRFRSFEEMMTEHYKSLVKNSAAEYCMGF